MFEMPESDVKSHMKVCSRHFPDGDVSKPPNPILGKRLASPRSESLGLKEQRERRKQAAA